ncbi:MAG: STAS domain-containing protein [Planctomycetes bacterium]|nr:STAS domain-containing protein [Planctomycetota bacterium]
MAAFRIDQNTVMAGNKEVQVLSLKGQVDMTVVPELEKKLTGLIEGGHYHLVCAMGELEYVSSAGLGVLLRIHRRLEKEGGRISLADVPEEILHVLKVLGFHHIVRVYPDVNTAVQATVACAVDTPLHRG